MRDRGLFLSLLPGGSYVTHLYPPYTIQVGGYGLGMGWCSIYPYITISLYIENDCYTIIQSIIIISDNPYPSPLSYYPSHSVKIFLIQGMSFLSSSPRLMTDSLPYSLSSILHSCPYLVTHPRDGLAFYPPDIHFAIQSQVTSSIPLLLVKHSTVGSVWSWQFCISLF